MIVNSELKQDYFIRFGKNERDREFQRSEILSKKYFWARFTLQFLFWTLK